MADYIPLAIQAEIMIRLPTKSLLQFRSVSKTWKSLIDSCKFIADYSVQNTQHHHHHHLLVSYFDLEDYEPKYVSIVDDDDDDDAFPQQKLSLTGPLPEHGRPRILGVSQGLFCVYSCNGGLRSPRMEAIALWNPSVRKSVAIALPTDALDRGYRTVFGFGVCPRSTDPMLVKVNYIPFYSDMDTFPWVAEVYTLSSGAWRNISTSFRPRSAILMTWNQVAINEIIYWLAVDVISRHAAVGGFNRILSFDMSSEEFTVVYLPEILTSASKSTLGISKLEESLVVLETVTEAQKQVHNVWMMEGGVGNSFTKLFTITAPDASVQRLVGFRKNKEPVFEMISSRSYFDVHDFLVHRHKSEQMSYIGILGQGSSFSASFYMESLLLLDH